MAPSSNLLEKCKKGLFDYSQDAGKMLLHTATAGWIFSSLGQIFGIATNKKISKKEKQFLIPQEIADAVVNITSFYVFTDKFQNFTKRLVAKGKIITPGIIEKCKEFGIQYGKDAEGKAANIGEAISKKINEYKGILEVNKHDAKLNLNIDQAKQDDINIKIKELEKFKNEQYGPFEGGLRIAGNVLGGIISSNIITPIIRNPMAAWKQRTAIEREKLEHDAKLYNENKVIFAQNSMNSDYHRAKLVNPAQITNSGSMRV